MKQKLRLAVSLIAILILAAGAGWIAHPKGSQINLSSLKIPFNEKFTFHLGLDLQGGSHLVYQADFKDVADADKKDALNAIRTTIERRVNAFGVSEPVVQVEGQDRIVVELPGIKDVNEAINQIGKTPFMEFRVENPDANTQPTIDENGQITIDPLAQWTPTGLSGKQLKRATADIIQAGQGSLSAESVVKLEFDEEGTKLFSEITSQNVGKRIAIFLDGQILSAPTVQTAITDGIAIISGVNDVKVSKELATNLNSGALPVPIKLISQQNVGATLGQESIHKSVIAGLIGLLLIAIFMLFNYRLPGVLAIIALLIYTIISFAIFKIGISITAVLLVGLFFFLGITASAWFGLLAFVSYIALMFLGGLSPVTLTLAGIAGFILSIGMAVDANILIFERLKEEIRAGKGVNQAINDGFARAWSSIRDSNISSLITVVILYAFGTPSIKGFAITLGIGILISMFTAITITRTLLKTLIGVNILGHPVLFGVNKINRAKEQVSTTAA